MKAIKPNSIDALVTDPPYGLEFMGKEWDRLWDKREHGGFRYNPSSKNLTEAKHTHGPQYKAGIEAQLWHTQWLTEAYRVLKPGASILVMGGTRTFHRLACAIEDTGFIIKDTLMFMYGSGFPKAQDLGKMIDKRMGAEREIIGINKHYCEGRTRHNWLGDKEYLESIKHDTAPATDLAKYWDGFKIGGIKPAFEPILWAIKGLRIEPKYVIIKELNESLGEILWQSIASIPKQDISKLQEMVSTGLNIVLLWNAILDALLISENRFTTSTESKTITELKILNSLLSANIPENMDIESPTYQGGIQNNQKNGLLLFVKIAEKLLAEENPNMKDILTVIAQGIAIYRKSKNGISAQNVEKDLQPIILSVFIALKSVLTGLSAESKEKESKLLVNIAEEFLRQKYVPQPFSAIENAWLKDIRKISPDFSPIIWAVKPPEGSYVDNVLKWGVGAVNVDECRVGYQNDQDRAVPFGNTKGKKVYGRTSYFESETRDYGDWKTNHKGRFPANVILDEEAGRMLDEQSGNRKTTWISSRHKNRRSGEFLGQLGHPKEQGFNDNGGASRFFYCAKASRTERNLGLGDLMLDGNRKNGIDKQGGKAGDLTCRGNVNPVCQNCGGSKIDRGNGICNCKEPKWEAINLPQSNNHPTVKPIALFEWLVKLVTREGQIVLDPFIGSGTTAIACYNANRKCVGIEKEGEYLEIAKRRIKYWEGLPCQQTLGL